ncbi:hypothetical protein [Desulfonatronovibrio hydrogenovorans]|uniref:hypothetical protein n=1 Tax=Desulfonatronovibrio hydrogenovorans TaxID=53245 RepID=UPI00068FCC3F|nr:hypothetical protein [Desulfonatronovibrio hydrogenovorans]
MKKIIILVLVTGLISWSCAPKRPVDVLPEKAVVAVASFSHPVHRWQMINNHVIVGERKIDQDVLKKLDSDLAALTAGSRHTVINPRLLEQCTELVTHGTSPGSAFHYWVQVGKCVPADYILVPFVFDWRERKGGEWGVDEPAKVTLELNLIDLNELRLNRYLFDERQQSLTENILGMGRFLQRGGKWVSARELAREGLELGVRELDL